jgi:SulP family sulfate permease
MIAVQNAWKQGLFKREFWLQNIIAGVIVGVVALPLGMAFAIASGLKPEQGIYTAIIAGSIVSVFGGSRLQITGPTGAFIVILASIVAQHGVVGLQVATVLAGVILIVLGLMKFGNFIKFIPDPVIVGFTSGIAVLIWVSQWQSFLGLPKIIGDHFHEKLIHLFTVLPEFHIATTLMACFSLFILIVSPRVPLIKKVPGPLLVLILGTGLQTVFNFNGVATIGSQFGGIPQGLPKLEWLPISFNQILALIGPAFTIAMLGAIESLLSAVVADGMAGTRHDSNQELVGQGLANLVVPFFGGFAATGAIARTATNIRYGGNSPLAGIIHSVTLILIIVFLAPLATNIPLCSLAAILFIVAYNMCEIKHFTHIVKYAPMGDIFILLVTFILTIFTDLVVAVNIGMILAMLHFLGRMSTTSEVRSIGGDALTEKMHSQNSVERIPSSLVVYSIEGPFFFGAVEKLQSALAVTHTDPKVVLIRLGHVPFMDITGLESFEEAIDGLQKRHITVLLSEANERVHHKLERMGLLEKIGPNGYFQDFSSALIYSNHLLPA